MRSFFRLAAVLAAIAWGGALVSCSSGSTKWTVKFMIGGEQFGEDMKVKDGERVSAPNPAPNGPSGYEPFASWRVGSADGEEYDFLEPVKGNLTLYATFANEYLTFTAAEDGAKVGFGVARKDNPDAIVSVVLQYRKGASGEWTDYALDKTHTVGSNPLPAGETITLEKAGDSVSFRAKEKIEGSFEKPNDITYHFFPDGEGKFDVSGRVACLYDPEDPDVDLSGESYEGAFYFLFAACTQLRGASGLKLPETFPVIGFGGMFLSCTSLTSAPELPAMDLVRGCYLNMFDKCVSLASAPALPATNLAEGCYESMFYGCTSLEIAPELPAAELAKSCYKSMFRECSKLKEVSVKFADWNSDEDATNIWLKDAGPAEGTKTFRCPSGLDTTTDKDESHVPDGWTVVSNDPA